jgi:hypothetical protein
MLGKEMELRTVGCRLISRYQHDDDGQSSIWEVREMPVGREAEWSHPEISQTLTCALRILETHHRSFMLPIGFFDLGVDEQHSLLRVFAVSAVLDDEELSAELRACEAGEFECSAR